MSALVALALSGVAVGYLLGRWRPAHRARDWAWWKVAIGKDPGRVKGAAIIALLPERFAPLLWHRLRHGHYPPGSQRRPAPALIEREHRESR